MNEILIILPQKPILVSSDEEIEKGDWFYNYSHGKFGVYMCEGVVGKSLIIQNKESSCWSDYSKKILAGIEGLPKIELHSSVAGTIAKETGWKNLEELAANYSGSRSAQSSSVNTTLHNARVAAFKEGYNYRKSIENKFSEEDMILAFFMGRDSLNNPLITKTEAKDIIKSISNKEPKQYLVEVHHINQCDGCLAKYPIDNGVHKVEYPSGNIVCQRNKYPITVTRILK